MKRSQSLITYLYIQWSWLWIWN